MNLHTNSNQQKSKSMKPNTRQSILTISSLCLFLLVNLATAQHKTTSYYIKVKTSNTSGAGTDNHIDIKIHGGTVDTGWQELKGSMEQGDVDVTYLSDIQDIGKIYAISLNVDGVLADKWTPELITITVGRDEQDGEQKKNSGGYYEFYINSELGYSPHYFKATHSYNLSPPTRTSDPVQRDVNITKISFYDNLNGSKDETVNKFVETWQDIESVSISTNSTTTIGASVTASYESPETAYGKFGLEATANWEKVVDEGREKSTQNLTESRYEWDYIVAANTAKFRRLEFTIPFEDAVYSDGQNSRIIRKLRGRITPRDETGSTFEIPQRRNERIEPVSWKFINDQYLSFMDNESRDKVIEKKTRWVQLGYVIDDFQNTPRHPNGTPSSGNTRADAEREYQIVLFHVSNKSSGSDGDSDIEIFGKLGLKTSGIFTFTETLDFFNWGDPKVLKDKNPDFAFNPAVRRNFKIKEKDIGGSQVILVSRLKEHDTFSNDEVYGERILNLATKAVGYTEEEWIIESNGEGEKVRIHFGFNRSK